MEEAQYQNCLDTSVSRYFFMDAEDLQIREATSGDSPGIAHGYVVKYGDVAKIYGFEEVVAAGAFSGLDSPDLIANYMHIRAQPLGRSGGSGLVLSDRKDGLYAELELPPTTRGNDTAIELRQGILRGFSAEFYPKQVHHR